MLLSIIHELRSTTSTNAKKLILTINKQNDEWRDYLVAVYNPFIVYGQSGDKINDQDDLENLKLCRSINAGITATTINQVYKKLIPTAAKIMKSKTGTPDQVVYPCQAEIKYDGHYTVIVVTEKGSFKMYTSGGHEYILPSEAVAYDELSELPRNVYMAERISDGFLGSRKDVALVGSKLDGQLQYCKPDSKFKVFDTVTVEEFDAGKSTTSFRERREILTQIIDYRNLYVAAAGGYVAKTEEEAREFAADVVSQGAEGIMLKQLNTAWRNSKSRKVDFLKYKILHTADLAVTAENAGKTKASQDVIGSLTVTDKNGTLLNVSSGLSDDQRRAWGAYIGNVVEVRYEHKNEDGTYVQPVFLHLRDDKTIDDID